MTTADKSIIDSIEWNGLSHAYGPADQDAPKYLRDLFNGDEDETTEAVYHFLHSCACHQYTTYSCTPYVVRCVVFLISQQDVGWDLMHDVIGFVYACTQSGKLEPKLMQEILLGKPQFERLSRHEDEKVAACAASLLAFCDTHSD